MDLYPYHTGMRTTHSWVLKHNRNPKRADGLQTTQRESATVRQSWYDAEVTMQNEEHKKSED